MHDFPRTPGGGFRASGRFHDHGHHGGGRFGGPPHGRGGGRFRRRLLAAADLQLVILSLLEDKPRHGYEIIKAVEERSSGYYSPSAGMVYPALTYLADLGDASVEHDGTKKLYTLTDAGQARVAQSRERIAAILSELAAIGQRMAGIAPPITVASGETNADGGDPLGQIFRELKAALFDAAHGDVPERARIIAILQRALAEIRGS